MTPRERAVSDRGFLGGAACGGEAGDNGYRQHNGEGNGGKPVHPGCGGEVSRFDQDGADGEGLDEHLDFP